MKRQGADVARRQIVLVAERNVGLDTLVAAVRERGFQVESVIGELATLVGSADDDQLDGIRHVAGVSSVSEEQLVQLPSPDSDGPF